MRVTDEQITTQQNELAAYNAAQLDAAIVREKEVKARKAQGIMQDSAIAEMRHMVKNFDCMREGFNESFTMGELITLHRSWMACGWDFYPDRDWTGKQVDRALRGIVPTWDNDEVATYPASDNPAHKTIKVIK
jgi:hypothetical protein